MQRFRQDVAYVSQGFVNSLVVLLTVLLAIAGLALIGLAFLQGSLGDIFRTFITPDQLMQILIGGGTAEIITLWTLSYFGFISRRLSLRLRWALAGWIVAAILLSKALGGVN